MAQKCEPRISSGEATREASTNKCFDVLITVTTKLNSDCSTTTTTSRSLVSNGSCAGSSLIISNVERDKILATSNANKNTNTLLQLTPISIVTPAQIKSQNGKVLAGQIIALNETQIIATKNNGDILIVCICDTKNGICPSNCTTVTINADSANVKSTGCKDKNQCVRKKKCVQCTTTGTSGGTTAGK